MSSPLWWPCFPFLLQPLPLHHLPPTYPSLSLHDNTHQPHGSRVACLCALCYSPTPPAPAITMPLVVGSREVARGATVGIRGGGRGSGLRFSPSPVCLEAEESSSIGFGRVSSEEGGDDGEEEVESGLSCLNALEESLPMKRGLSSYFSGKSKSFASLSDVASQTSVKELAKSENPCNKRRRILVACTSGWSRGASLNASMPQLPAELKKTEEGIEEGDEEGEDSEEEEEEESRDQLRPTLPMKLHSKETFGS